MQVYDVVFTPIVRFHTITEYYKTTTTPLTFRWETSQISTSTTVQLYRFVRFKFDQSENNFFVRVSVKARFATSNSFQVAQCFILFKRISCFLFPTPFIQNVGLCHGSRGFSSSARGPFFSPRTECQDF